jgi:23S rRNA pseudouridine955/2504/2580 synthase
MLIEIHVSVNDAGQRAERFLRRYLPQLSTGRLQSLFRRKEIKVARKAIEQGHMLKAGDVLQVFGIREEEAQRPPKVVPTAAARRAELAEAYPPPPIIFEDHDLLVVNKPSGMAAHPGSGILPGASLIERVHLYLSGPDKHASPKKRRLKDAEKKYEENKAGGDGSLEDLLFGGSREGLSPGWGNELFSPSLVHRLDKETSGALLIAKSGSALRELTEALRAGRIKKRYLALVAGHPQPASGTIDAALARADSPTGAKSYVADEEDGKRSVTRYKTIRIIGGHALLQVVIETGRMHQIRAHLAHVGHPIAGDTRYSNERPAEVRERMKALGLTRLFLHAEELSWTEGAAKRTFRAPLPPELARVVSD